MSLNCAITSSDNGLPPDLRQAHYADVIMGTIASQITSLNIVYSTVYSDADQRKHQSSASLAFVWGIHRGPMNSPHKWPVKRKMFPFGDVIMHYLYQCWHNIILIILITVAITGTDMPQANDRSRYQGHGQVLHLTVSCNYLSLPLIHVSIPYIHLAHDIKWMWIERLHACHLKKKG